MKSIERQYQDEIDDLKDRLTLAETKLREFEVEWEDDKGYVFTPRIKEQ